jgi:hypothetical protein
MSWEPGASTQQNSARGAWRNLARPADLAGLDAVEDRVVGEVEAALRGGEVEREAGDRE